MRVVWSQAARRDLASLLDHWTQVDERFARRPGRRLLARIVLLESAPLQGRPVAGTAMRVLSLPDVRYVLSYRPTPGLILIVRIRHMREVRDDHDLLR